MVSTAENSAFAVINRLIDSIGPRTELVMTFFEDGRFGYYCSSNKGFLKLAKQFGWLLTDNRIDESGIITGEGYYATQWFDACFWQCKSERRSIDLEHILRNNWQSLERDEYYPHNMPFRHFEKDGYKCYYIYDYYTKNSKHERTDLDKRARNLIFNMKNGIADHQAARILGNAINLQFDKESKSNHLIIPIAASTIETHTKRFSRFCQLLSWYTGIKNGYDTVEVVEEKIEIIPKSLVSLHHIKLDNKKLHRKSVFLIDDVYTTGGSFTDMVYKLKKHGITDIQGIFLSKTNFD